MTTLTTLTIDPPNIAAPGLPIVPTAAPHPLPPPALDAADAPPVTGRLLAPAGA